MLPPAGPSREEADDRRRAVHRRLRRHAQDRVLAQQRDEAVDVGALPGVDVAAQQVALGRPRRPRRRRRELGVDRRPRPLQGAVDRGDGRVEQLGDLGRGPAEHVAQDQDRPLAAGQVLDRGQEGELDALRGA